MNEVITYAGLAVPPLALTALGIHMSKRKTFALACFGTAIIWCGTVVYLMVSG